MDIYPARAALPIALMMTSVCFAAGAVEAAAPTAATDDRGADTDEGWPRQRVSGQTLVTLYQPQVERWQDDKLQARAAVEVQTADRAAPSYAVVSFSARVDVDKPDRVAQLEEVAMRDAVLPLSRDDEQAVRQWLPAAVHHVALDRLQASLVASADASRPKPVAVRNDPPRILVVTKPSVLVSLDGPPAFRPVADRRLERIINTRALVLHDREGGRFYLYLGDCWMSAPRLDGLWNQAATGPALALDRVKRDAVAADPELQLFADEEGPVRRLLDRGIVPRIIISSVPAALVELHGEPQLQLIMGTRLYDVPNSDAALFRPVGDDYYYLLLSGRWFRSRALLDGRWSFVRSPPRELQSIPESHPKAWALASVPGTPAARDAVLANGVPQTATVRRAGPTLAVRYDGAPRLAAVDGSSLRYTVNSATPVIRTAAGGWYALADGVWFAGKGPHGPWRVATAVPDAIYAIPPSSPLHYVTYARIYEVGRDVVRVGYLPGYLGSYVSDTGTVVRGTGYSFRGWCGARWIAPPSAFDDATGPPDLGRSDAYAAWSSDVIVDDWATVHAGVRPRLADDLPANDVYAGRDGVVYRRTGSGWQRFDEQGWQPVDALRPWAPTGGLAYGGASLGELDRERDARVAGTQRWERGRASTFAAR